MRKIFKLLVITALLLISGCSNLFNQNDEPSEIDTPSSYFNGTIKEISDNTALVSAELGGSKGDVFVNLSVNNDETFQVGDKIKVGYDGTIMESNPAQINTLSVELVD